MMGGFFKWHWNDGQPITVKVDEPSHPLNAAFKGQSVGHRGRDLHLRSRHLLALEPARADERRLRQDERRGQGQGDQPAGRRRLRAQLDPREGKGRVFYEAHGHNEKVYAHKLLLEHVLAGMQYVLGDLKADDRPSVKR